MYIPPRKYIVRIQKSDAVEGDIHTITMGTFNNEHDWYELIIDLLECGYKFAYRVTDAEYSIYVVY